MFRIRLETQQAEFVSNAWVSPCTPVPQVVMWGLRVFVLHLDPPEPEGVPVYREAFYLAAFSENIMGVDQVTGTKT